MNTSEGMQDFLAYHRRMLGLMSGVCLAVTAILFAAMRENYAWSGGFAIGSLAQLLKFGVLDLSTVKRLASQQSASVQIKATLLSLILFGLAAAGVFILHLNVWAMAAGIFVPRLILIGDAYIRPNPFGTADPETEPGRGKDALDARES